MTTKEKSKENPHNDGHNSSLRNFGNAVLMVGVIVPPALLTYHLRSACDDTATPPITELGLGPSGVETGLFWLEAVFLRQELPPGATLCGLYTTQPFVYLNLVYLLVVDIGFYLIYLLQNSTWLIDPHWQLIPQCIAAFWFTHPISTDNNDDDDGSHYHHPRALLTMVFLNVWAVRLLHNYFRRERWNFGHQEDWRYGDMRKEHGIFWIVTQFFAVSLAQHGMLVGLTMPLQATMARDGDPLNVLDAMAAVVCTIGILIGFVADNQLWRYMNTPNKPTVLNTGLWRYSRHPNHFGEQAWWIGLLLFGVAAKSTAWPICFGVLFNHSLDTLVTLPMIEQRMLRRPERAEAFREYQSQTSLLVPLPPFRKQKAAGRRKAEEEKAD